MQKRRPLQSTVLLLALIQIATGLSTRPKYVIPKVKQTTDKDEDSEKQEETTGTGYQRTYKTRTSSILATLLHEYDKRVRPNEDKYYIEDSQVTRTQSRPRQDFKSVFQMKRFVAEKAMYLGLNVYFNTLSSLDEENMEFDIDFYLREMWTDPRLNFTHLIINGTNRDKHILVEPPERVWVPDVFMENSKHASFHMVTKKNEMLRLWPNGSLFYSVRITAKVSCFMVLYHFPLDEQECVVQFSSYKYTREEVTVNWKKWLDDPLVQISPNIKLARYTITGIETRKDVINYGIGGYYDYLVVAIRFQRDVGHYILQQYMPCSYIVILSWVCFWIEADCVGDRISIGVTLVLTIVLLQGSLNTNMPKVSYSKYIDYYFNSCLAFLMGSIIESLVVYKYYKLQKHSATKVLEPRISSQSLFLMRTRKENWNWGSMDERKTPVHPSVRSMVAANTISDQNMSQKIDRVSRLLFPVLFIMFNILYHFYFNIV